MSRLFLTIALTLVIVTPASAEKNVKIDPKLASLGAPVAEVTFDDAEVTFESSVFLLV